MHSLRAGSELLQVNGRTKEHGPDSHLGALKHRLQQFNMQNKAIF